MDEFCKYTLAFTFGIRFQGLGEVGGGSSQVEWSRTMLKLICQTYIPGTTGPFLYRTVSRISR
jgi:hypothetical protein